MLGKFIYGGEGAKVPGTDFGVSFSLFKLWLQPTGGDWAGYTTASNEGLLGFAIVETPIVEFTMRDLEDEEPFMHLHGSSVDITISSTIFVKDGGTARITVRINSNNAGAGPRELTFFSDSCKGASAAIGDIHFRATLVMLEDFEKDPTDYSYLPW